MREGKYVEEVAKWMRELPDDYPQPHAMLLVIAEKVADDHPVWYARFWVRGWAIKVWRWVTSKTWSATSKRSGE